MQKDVKSLSEALRLQHTRCEVYQLWDAKFHTALSGVLSPTDLAATLSNSIVTAFQHVSTSLRELQEKTRKEDGEVYKFLDMWIDRVQRLEQEHYRTSVQLQQVLVQHCAAIPQANSKDTTTTTTDVVVTGKEGEEEESNDNKKEKENVEAVVNYNVCASLHDSEQCAARHLIPVSSQSALTFVSCRDAMFFSSDDDDDDDDKKKDFKPEEDLINNNNNNNNNSDIDDEKVPFVLKSGEEVVYIPREVQQRCLAFNKEIMPLYHMKRKLKQELQEWTEELQEELAAATATG